MRPLWRNVCLEHLHADMVKFAKGCLGESSRNFSMPSEVRSSKPWKVGTQYHFSCWIWTHNKFDLPAFSAYFNYKWKPTNCAHGVTKCQSGRVTFDWSHDMGKGRRINNWTSWSKVYYGMTSIFIKLDGVNAYWGAVLSLIWLRWSSICLGKDGISSLVGSEQFVMIHLMRQ